MPIPAPWLPKSTLTLIARGLDALQTTYAERLRAALVVGAAASPVRHDRARSPEILAVVETTTVADARRLAELAGATMRHGLRYRLLTAEELASSSDVFALEVAEWRDRHVLLAGRDPFGAITIDPADLRRSLEQAARGLARQLRNRVLSAVGTEGRRGDAHFALAMALERCVELAHHALALAGDEVPSEEPALLRAFAVRIEVDPEPVVELLEKLRSRGELEAPWEAMAVLVPYLEATKRTIDRMATP